MNKNLANDEAYTLNVDKKNIIIEAKTSNGAFYGIQSLIQIMPYATNKNSIAVQCITIEDYPRFSYRGMHLDVGRHFFPVSFIKKYIDELLSKGSTHIYIYIYKQFICMTDQDVLNAF